MDRRRLSITYGSFIHLLCNDGYISATGLEGESLIIRDKNEVGVGGVALPLLGFEMSVFRIEPPAWMAAANAQLEADDDNDRLLLTEHRDKNSKGESQLAFGQAFVLVHLVSQLQVAVFPSRPSENDSDCVKLLLVKPGGVESVFCEFVFLSRYKVHSDGDSVCRGDSVLMRLAAYPIFVHVTEASAAFKAVTNVMRENMSAQLTFVDNIPAETDGTDKRRWGNCLTVACNEVNGSEEMSVTFVVERYDINQEKASYQLSASNITQQCIQSGVPVMFYHREFESLLTTNFTLLSQEQREQQRKVSFFLNNSGKEELENDGTEVNGAFFATRGCNSAVEGVMKSGSAAGLKKRGFALCDTDNIGNEDGSAIEDDDGTPYPLFARDDTSAGGAFCEKGSIDHVPCGCTALWIFENEDPTVGGAVGMYSTMYRLRQACSNFYLAAVGSAADDSFENDMRSETANVSDYFAAEQLREQSDHKSSDNGNVRATKLSMIPPPRSQKDLQRTLFFVKPMFTSECGFLAENECFLLQNALTGMYVLTHERTKRLFLHRKPSAHHAVVVRTVSSEIGRNVLLLWTQCERLCYYCDAFQALATENESQQRQQKMEKKSEEESEKEKEKETEQPHFLEKSIYNLSELSISPSFLSFVPDGEWQADILKSSVKPQKDSKSVLYASLLPIVRMCQRILAELIRFCSLSHEQQDVLRKDGIPIIQNQCMMFDMKMHRLVVDVILVHFTQLVLNSPHGKDSRQLAGSSVWGYRAWGCGQRLPELPLRGGVINVDDIVNDTHMDVHFVCRLAFRLLRQMVRRAPPLKVGLDNFIPFFFELDKQGFCVVDTVAEILSHNPNVSMSVIERVVNYFVDVIHHKRRAKYLEPLAFMCHVGFCGIAERQALICQKLLIENGEALPRFVLNRGGEWAVVSGKGSLPVSCDIFFDPLRQNHGADVELPNFVHGVIDLLGRMCFEGCPSTCREEVAKIFPSNVLLRAVQTFVWTGNEVAGRHSSFDLLRGRVLRLALRCYIVPCIDNHAGKLRAGTVLFGSSLLRIGDKKKLPLSGNPDDELVHEVKLATLSIIRSNHYFVQYDIYRSVLLRASLNVWFYVVRAYQITVEEVGSLIPPLLGLLDGRRDVINDDIGRVAEHTLTRLELSEASEQVMKTRRMICMILLQLLEGSIHRAADKIILFLHDAFLRSCWPSPCRHRKDASIDVIFLRPEADIQEKCSGERQPLLSATSGSADAVGGSQNYWYQAVNVDTEMKDMRSMSIAPEAVVEYLLSVSKSIGKQFCVDEIVPRLMDLTRYNSPRLRAQAIELLVRLCTVKRGVAQRVLQVHALPSADIIESFDKLYTVAVDIYSLRRRGCMDEGIALALENMENVQEAPHDVFFTAHKGNLADSNSVYDDYGNDDEEDENIDKDDWCDVVGGDDDDDVGDVKGDYLFGGSTRAARTATNRRSRKGRRYLLGLAGSSETPLRYVIRAEMVCHWGIHITLLGMYSSIDPKSQTFLNWMRFFYLFTFSRNNARKLQPSVELFLSCIFLNEQCMAMCLYTIISILATVADPNRYLTTTFLKGCMEYLRNEMAVGHFDSNLFYQLNDYIFSKPVIGGRARRQMMKFLGDYDILSCLPRPGVNEVLLRSNFINSLVELLCATCSSSTSALVMGQLALPRSNIVAIILEYGSLYSPVHASAQEHGSLVSKAFSLVDTYLRALVMLYFTSFKEEDGIAKELRKKELMVNSELWAIFLLLTEQLRMLSEMITADEEKVVSSGFSLLQSYRQVWLVSIPIALFTFFSECFSEASFYRYQHTIGPSVDAICDSLVSFFLTLLSQSGAFLLDDHEVLYYRRLFDVLYTHLAKIFGLTTRVSNLDAARNKIIIWQVQRDKAKKAERQQKEEQQEEHFDAQSGQKYDDIIGGYMDSRDGFFAWDGMLPGLRSVLSLPFISGLLLPGATARRREMELIRNALNGFVNSYMLISVKDSMDMTEAAGVVNALLHRAPNDVAVRAFIENVLDSIQKQCFSAVALLGMLNLFSNALYTAVFKEERHLNIWKSTVMYKDNEEFGHRLQITFSNLGMSRVIASLCAFDNDILTYSAIRVGVMLLEGGNQHAQKAFMDYFQTHQEGFFCDLRDLMQNLLEWVQHVNMMQRIAIMERGISAIDTQNVQKFTSALFAGGVSGLPLCVGRRGCGGNKGRKGRRLLGWDGVRGCLRLRLLCKLFRLLQLFCEGHNIRMQNYIRSQHDNMHNVNVLYEIILLIEELSTTIHPVAFGVLRGGLELLTELCQGPCNKNQEALLGYDICATICDILNLLNRPEAVGIEFEQVTNTRKLDTARHAEGCITDANSCNEDSDLSFFSLSQQSSSRACQLTVTDTNLLCASVTTCLLSLIEGFRSFENFDRIFAQVPIEIIEQQFSFVTPEICYHILEDEDFENDPCVEALFNWLIFLNTIRPFATGQYLQRIEELLHRVSGLNSRLGVIEIQRADGLLERVFFRIPLICSGLTRRMKDNVLWSVSRTNRATKLGDLLHQTDDLIFEVERYYAFKRWVARWSRFKLVFCKNVLCSSTVAAVPVTDEKQEVKVVCKNKIKRLVGLSKWCWNKFFAPVIFSTRLLFYESVSLFLAVLMNFGLIWTERDDFTNKVVLESQSFLFFCILQSFVSFVAFCIDVFVFFPVTLYREYRRKQRFEHGLATANLTMQEVYNGLSTKEIIYLFCTQSNIQFRLFLVVMAFMSVFVSYYFAASHLLLIIYRVPALRAFVSAITYNGKQLLFSAFIDIVLLYFFAIAGYFFFRKKFDDGEETENCNSLLRCFIYISWQGLRKGGGVGDIMRTESWTSSSLFSRISYDLLFFAFVNVVFLNVMFGVIIDTFGKLRDDRREKERDMMSKCFVCGLDAEVYEKAQIGGFKTHVSHEHNMWMYVYFMHYLRRKNPVDFTGQESYVYEKSQRNDLTFFPDGNSLSIEERKKKLLANFGHNQVMKRGDEDKTLARRGDNIDSQTAKNYVGNTQQLGVVALEELSGVKEAFNVFFSEVSADAQKLKLLLKELENTAHAPRGASSTRGTQEERKDSSTTTHIPK